MIVLHILGIILKIIGITLLSVLGLIVLLLLLVSLVRVGVEIEYIAGKPKLAALVAGKRLQLYPRPPRDPNKPKKEKKPKKKKAPAQPADAQQPAKKKKKLPDLSITADDVIGLLKKLFKGVGRIFTVRVEKFMLHYIAAGHDPYRTARTFGIVNATLDAMAPICRKKHPNADVDVWTACDFTVDAMTLDLRAALTMRIGQVFEGAFIILFGAIGIAIRVLLRTRREKRELKKLGLLEPTDKKANKEIENTTNTQAAERTE